LERRRAPPPAPAFTVTRPDGLAKSLPLTAGTKVIDLRRSNLVHSSERVVIGGQRLDDEDLITPGAEVLVRPTEPLQMILQPSGAIITTERDDRTVGTLLIDMQCGQPQRIGMYAGEERVPDSRLLRDIDSEMVILKPIAAAPPVVRPRR
jgi:hypothetical protein